MRLGSNRVETSQVGHIVSELKKEPDLFLFLSELERPFQWRHYATSAVVHVGAVVVLCLIPLAIIQHATRQAEVTHLYVPVEVKPYKPPPVKLQKLIAPKQVAKVQPPPKPMVDVKPPVVPPEVKPQPRIPEPPKLPEPKIAAAAPAPKIEAAPIPAAAPKIRTGVFAAETATARLEAPKQLKVGGFGDPHGATPNPTSTAPSTIAKVGQFDLAQGDNVGKGGRPAVVTGAGFGDAGTGNLPRGTGGNGTAASVKTGGFGDSAAGGAGGRGGGGSVHSGGFGDASVAAPAPVQQAKAAEPTATPVQILFKPKPIYTQEARNLKVEGQVWLEVEFRASGQIDIVRVVRGLDHGLNEAAEQAVMKIKFKPATRDDAPVDTKATVNITFELT
jgi:TonB family protein